MSEWINIGDNLLNIDGIESIERVNDKKIIIYMSSGKIIEVTETMAINVWNYLVGQRLKFLDVDNPTRDFG